MTERLAAVVTFLIADVLSTFTFLEVDHQTYANGS